jgi:hypothetical protein
MDPLNHSRPELSRSDAGRDSFAGSIGLLLVFAAMLLAASHPWITVAVASGSVGARLVRRAVRVVRARRPEPVPTGDAGSDVWTASRPE